MFELLAHAAHLHGALSAHGEQSLNLVGGQNEVYNSFPTAGAPWTADYQMRAVDADGTENEGGASGPYACDGDGFGCFVYNRQAFDNGKVSNGTYDVYTNFGTDNEIRHGRDARGGKTCAPWNGVDCNGIA